MRKLHAHFCTENKGFFSGRYLRYANKETSCIPDLEGRCLQRLEASETPLGAASDSPPAPIPASQGFSAESFLGLKPLRIVGYAARIPSRPQADRLCGSQAKVFELRRFRYSSIARAENSKSSFLQKFE